MSETRTSGGIFLLSLTYCSNCADDRARPAPRSRATSPLVLGQQLGLGLEEARVVDEARDAGARRCPRPAPSRCRRAASAAAARWRRCRRGRCRRGRDRPGSAFFWATSRICLSSFITSSSARTDFSRPTNSGTIMCGKTTMSRSGRTGKHGALRNFAHLTLAMPPAAAEAAARTSETCRIRWRAPQPVSSATRRIRRGRTRRRAPASDQDAASPLRSA